MSWDRGTAQCHDGDRPWLAGAKRDEVFMATNTAEEALSHRIFRSGDGGQTCEASGIPDAGKLPDGTEYTGNGSSTTTRAATTSSSPSRSCATAR